MNSYLSALTWGEVLEQFELGWEHADLDYCYRCLAELDFRFCMWLLGTPF